MTTAFPINVSVMLGMNTLARQPDASAMDVVDSIQNNFWPSYLKGWLLWRKFRDSSSVLSLSVWLTLPFAVDTILVCPCLSLWYHYIHELHSCSGLHHVQIHTVAVSCLVHQLSQFLLEWVFMLEIWRQWDQSRNRNQFSRQDNKRYYEYGYYYCCAKDGCSSSVTFARKNQTNGGKDKKSDGRALRCLEEGPALIVYIHVTHSEILVGIGTQVYCFKISDEL